MGMQLRVNKERLKQNIEELAQFGLNANGGVDRSIGSEADLLARKWLTDYAEKLGPGYIRTPLPISMPYFPGRNI